MLMMAEDEATGGMRMLLKRHSRLMLTKTYNTSDDNSLVETPGGRAGSSPYPSNTGDQTRENSTGQKRFLHTAATALGRVAVTVSSNGEKHTPFCSNVTWISEN